MAAFGALAVLVSFVWIPMSLLAPKGEKGKRLRNGVACLIVGIACVAIGLLTN